MMTGLIDQMVTGGHTIHTAKYGPTRDRWIDHVRATLNDSGTSKDALQGAESDDSLMFDSGEGRPKGEPPGNHTARADSRRCGTNLGLGGKG